MNYPERTTFFLYNKEFILHKPMNCPHIHGFMLGFILPFDDETLMRIRSINAGKEQLTTAFSPTYSESHPSFWSCRFA